MIRDEDLDRELRRALDVAPSTDFAVRVRAEIASAPATSGGLNWIYGASALAVVAVLVIGVAVDRRGDSAAVRETSPGPGPDVRAATQSREPSADKVAPAGPVVERSAVRPRQPEILIPASEIRAFRRLVTLASQGDEALESMRKVPLPETIPEVEPVRIAPISIEPLDSSTY